MRDGVRIVNCARGGIINEADLQAALESGHVAGAALDVFRQEPLPPEHRFWTHPKVHITPHVAAITPMGPASSQIAEKIRRLARNEPVTGIVPRDKALALSPGSEPVAFELTLPKSQQSKPRKIAIKG